MSLLIATTLDDALAALAAGARPIAGGTDLVVGARHGKAPLPASLVAIDRIESLRTIERSADGGLVIGAGVSHHTIETDADDRHRVVGARRRQRAGRLARHPPRRHARRQRHERLAGDGHRRTARRVRRRGRAGARRAGRVGSTWPRCGSVPAAPRPPPTNCASPSTCRRERARSGSAYLRLEYRRAMEIAVVGAAASVTLTADGAVDSVRVALTAVAATIVEVTGLTGGSVADVAAAAQAAAADQATPISDLRASDRYRRHCIGVMARRAVEAAARRAAGETIAIPVNRAVGIGMAAGATS